MHWKMLLILGVQLVWFSDLSGGHPNQFSHRQIARPDLLTHSFRWREQAISKICEQTISDREDLHSITILAWCSGSYGGTVPPLLFEELLLLVKVRDRFELICLDRQVGLGGHSGTDWGELETAAGAMTWRAQFERNPSDNELSEFIAASGFGFKKYGLYHPYEVVWYGDLSANVAKVVKTGLTSEERARREALEEDSLDP